MTKLMEGSPDSDIALEKKNHYFFMTMRPNWMNPTEFTRSMLKNKNNIKIRLNF